VGGKKRKPVKKWSDTTRKIHSEGHGTMQARKGRRFTIMISASMLMMLSCLGHGWAQILNGPYGLALDGKGNLYVANVNSDQVLVYDPNYVQQAAMSITSGLSAPVGVAFDSKGNVYVANLTGGGGDGSITQYSSAGVQNTRFLITDGVAIPTGITVDGLDDLHVLNFLDVTVYPLADTLSGPFLLTTIPVDTSGCEPLQCAIAVHGGDLYVGELLNPKGWEKGFVSELLAGVGRFPVFQVTTGGVVALSTDRAGDLYVVTGNGEVDVWAPKGGSVVFLQPLSFTPAGIAVDSARGRVYVSNFLGNSVLVYSTRGTLLHTIQ
jgi:DNA-binding beta-propeller fold protein YncE